MPRHQPLRFADNNRNLNLLLETFKRERPDFYAFLMEKLQQPNLGETQDQSSIWDKIAAAAGEYYRAKQTKEVIDLQTQRARDGLPPLDMDKYGAPPMRVEVAPDLQTKTLLEQAKIFAPLITILFIVYQVYKGNVRK